MTSSPWLATVRIAHRVPGRVRLRYQPRADQPVDPRVLERLASRLDGVTGARVNPSARSLILSFDPVVADAEALCHLVADLRHPQAALSKGIPAPADFSEVAVPAATLLLGTMLPPQGQLPLAVATSIPLFRHALDDYRREGINSHVLEAMAVAISLGRGGYLTANATTAMLALGDYLENSISQRSDALLKTLLRPASDKVWVVRDGQEVQVPAQTVAVGDTVVIGAGEMVPIDGTVLSGEAMVNEAAMTGESVSVVKSRGASVMSGTLVEEGRLCVYAEHVGDQTAQARIADYVEQALQTKSETQMEASRQADRLVPVVLKLAGLTWLVSGQWGRAASVLQGDYSCALKLATPVTFKSAMYGAARAGVLVKSANALERLAQADTFVFDKTGTLTSGSLAVTDVVTFDAAFSEDDLICLAASIEEHYFHPIAQAVVSTAKSASSRHFEHQEVEFIVAHGVASTVDGKRIVVGSRHFVEEDEGISVDAHRSEIERLYRDGKTLLFIGFDNRLLGILALKDRVRDNSAETVRRLRALGARKILMLTGDHREQAEGLAEALGLDECHAQLLPEDKARIIADLNAQGARIAFIGDGINDAPALAGAHVGIAMMKGADIARLTADIALLEDDVACVADAKAVANETIARIGSNYRLTVGLNTSILLAAALGVLSPLATAVLHNGTTLGLLLNAFRPVSSAARNKTRRHGLGAS